MDDADTWRPASSSTTWRARARLLALVREFFRDRDVLEVETPVLARTTVTDPAIDSIEVGVDGQSWYLQTSPEYHLKRMLAAGAPSIYRLGPVFRTEETGLRHNPEFTMIEWYRLGFSTQALMDEVAALVDVLIGAGSYQTIGYDELISQRFGVNANAGEVELRAVLATFTEVSSSVDRRELLDLVFAAALDSLGAGRYFVVDYPADQAALARTRLNEKGREVAERFELVVDGVEIANGYQELTDASVMATRMASDQLVREADGRPSPAPDQRLLAAMTDGLPDCAGVAVGFDRLVMRAIGAGRIDEVMTFPFDRA